MSNEIVDKKEREYMTESEARTVKDMFKKYLKLYKEKDNKTSDEEWLAELFKKELPEITDEEAKNDSRDIVESIKTFDNNLASCNEAASRGISKETWLSNKLQEVSVGMSVNDFGRELQKIDDI